MTYKLSLGAEVEAVVEDLGIGQACELVAELTNTGVHDETLEIDVGQTGN